MSKEIDWDKTLSDADKTDDMERNFAETQKQHFFTTSSNKLALMSICTLGLYDFYWFYKNWILIKQRTGKNIMPFWRAFFAPIWAYYCFKDIKAEADKNYIPDDLSPALYALLFFICQALVNLPDPYWIISLFTFAFLIPANSLALEVNKQLYPEFENNDKFTGWNWLVLIVGGLLVIMGVIGTFLPEVGEIAQSMPVESDVTHSDWSGRP